jgi:polyisoprenoid-binding protein YceI
VNKKLLYGGAALLLVAILAYVIFGVLLRAPEAASGPISAIPIATRAPATSAPAESSASATSAPAAAATTAPDTTRATSAPAAVTADQLLFQIVPDQSEARFKLSEVLRGQPTNVLGKTNQVAGQISITPNDLSTSQLGTIQINARTFATDSSQRNRAINNFILETANYEFITFKPTAITGLSGKATLGQAYSFEIAGDLTIRDVTKPVVFKATATPESADKLTGTASAAIKRGDFNLTIPSVPFVADVSDDVTLEIDFVAAPVT